MAMHKSFHQKHDMDRMCVDASIQGVKDYIKENKERLTTAASCSSGNISID